jgi:hypothetical protein
MQLVLPREDDTAAAENAPLDVVRDIGVTRASKHKLQQCELPAYKSCLFLPNI